MILNRKAKNILVIDDNEDNLLLVQLILEAQGHRISLACCGRDGLSAINTIAPNLDLIILDLMMPDMSGLDVVERIKANEDLNQIPILLLTANIELKKEDLIDVDELCHKPFEINSFLLKIKSLLFGDRVINTIFSK